MTQNPIPILVVSIFCIGTVAAEEPRQQPSPDTIFTSLDRDGDQRLSKSEATGDRMLTDHFSSVDKNSDGFLSKREYSTHIEEMKGERARKNY